MNLRKKVSELYGTAVRMQQAGQLGQASLICEQILHLDPRHADTLHLLGLITYQLGRREAAVELINRAINARPLEAIFYSNLGYMFNVQGELVNAINRYRQEISINPNNADAYSRLGSALRIQGKMSEAEVSFRKAIEIQPNFSEAYNNFGNVLQDVGRANEAIASYTRAIRINPNYAEAYNNLGKVYLDNDRLDDAVISFQQATRINPNLGPAYSNLGKVLLMQGYVDQARDAYRKSGVGKTSSSAAIKIALMTPPIIGSRSEITVCRAGLEKNLSELFGKLTLVDPVAEDCSTNFYLAFQGVNDCSLQKKIATFYEVACPSLLYEAPHCEKKILNERNVIRLGFISKFIYTHSVSLSFRKIISELSMMSEFEVVLISEHDYLEKNATVTYANFKGQHIRIPHGLAEARFIISKLKLDILVFLDIGMEPLSYFLAFARLAPVQCVMGGHPVTTGIANMDYYLSTDLAEPSDAELHYSEKLVRFPVGAFYFERPELPKYFKNRSQLGLPESGRLYMCPMTLQKIHPDFDVAVANILELDRTGHVIFFEDKKYTAWKGLLEKRFARSISEDLRERIVFLPWINNYYDFISAAKAADVILDTFHFGIGSTAIATCSVGTPLVTLPGEFLRGRTGLNCCKLLQTMECVAINSEDYAEKAYSIANNTDLRSEISNKIIRNSHYLFENRQAISDLSEFFSKVSRI